MLRCSLPIGHDAYARPDVATRAAHASGVADADAEAKSRIAFTTA